MWLYKAGVHRSGYFLPLLELLNLIYLVQNRAKCIILHLLLFFLCSLPKVISIICSLESQDLVIEWLDEDGGKKRYCFQEKQE